jgi:hypothetical protein
MGVGMVAFARFLETLSAFVPVEVLAPFVALLVAVGVPTWLRGVREKQVRERARRLVRASPGDVERIADEAVVLAKGDAALVRRFAADARRLGVPRAEARALASLGDVASNPHAAPVEDGVAPWRAWAAVQELRAAGADAAADRRLAEARARWPSFEAWASLPEASGPQADVVPLDAPDAPDALV